MASFVKTVCFFVNYAIFHELCDRMRFAVDCAKSHHRVISEGLNTRSRDNLVVPFCRTAIAQRSFSYRAITAWNSLISEETKK